MFKSIVDSTLGHVTPSMGEIGESDVFGTGIVQRTTDKVRSNIEKLKAAKTSRRRRRGREGVVEFMRRIPAS
ncbi:hypothetical protein Tco_0740186 [Tanacetum coccineum]